MSARFASSAYVRDDVCLRFEVGVIEQNQERRDGGAQAKAFRDRVRTALFQRATERERGPVAGGSNSGVSSLGSRSMCMCERTSSRSAWSLSVSPELMGGALGDVLGTFFWQPNAT